MGCLRISSSRKGIIDISSYKKGKIDVSSERKGYIDISSERHGNIDVSCTRKGRILVSSSMVCTLSNMPYLEIQPTVIWMIPDISVDNDVLSNTDWNID